MKTSLLITIEHPDNVSADGLIEHAIKPVLNDINADSDNGWSVNIVGDKRDRAVRTAISLALSEFPEEWSNEEILDNIHADHDLVLVWERFENWDADEIVEYINDTSVAIYTTYF
jgi:hypothetical protein